MTILISLAIAIWLLICVGAIALARAAAHGDRQAPPDDERRFERGRRRQSARNPR